ncbi:MAG: endopeptidase La [Armatimonadota bacterium]
MTNSIKKNYDDLNLSKEVNEAPVRLPRTLSVLPVRDTVYFPHMLFPLFVGREKSVKALDYSIEKHRYICLVAQKEVSIEDPEPEDLYDIGIIAEVMQVLRVPDGTVRVTLEGIQRVKISDYISTEPFFKAKIKLLKSSTAKTARVEALMRSVVTLFDRLVQSQGGQSARPIPPELIMNVLSIDDPSKLSDTIIPNLPLRIDEKQSFLETIDTSKRLENLNLIMQKEIEVLDIQRNIRARVEKEVGEMQREYLLREQLKAIQNELGEKDGKANELDHYRENIHKAGMPEEVAEKALKELDRLEKMPYAAPEGSVIRNYLDWLLSVPWKTRNKEKLDIDKASEILNNEHYGLEQVKDRILEFLAVRKLNKSTKGPILCFAGPPGVGKTSLGKSIASALGRKFYRISLGGVRDEAEIRGHRRTYVGALPGRIIQGLKQVGTKNPVFMLDEVDKLGMDFRGDPSSALLEALDPEQNSSFSDHFLEVPFDLSEVMFITTANFLENIPPALRDRMEVIRFSGYTEEEKMEIAKIHLLPKQIKDNGLNDSLIRFQPNAIKKIIREYTREAGVRNLERELSSICRKVAKSVARGNKNLSVITEKAVEKHLGAPRFRYGKAGEKDEVAVATGLVYTEAGGDTVPIEVVITPGDKNRLILTGRLGDVMQESAKTAFTYIRSRADKLKIDQKAISSNDIHIHVPEGATPKDGPSAGVTIATAIASAFTGRAIRKDIAMTGEITLRGNVLPVGGIKEKVLAAHRAGVSEVILPSENESSLDDLPANVRKGIKFHLVDTADQVLEIALLGK